MASYPIHCTESAISQIQARISDYAARTGIDAMIQISIRHRGCSGLSYAMEFVTETSDKDYNILELKLSIKADSLMWTMGTCIDYRATDVSEGFVFINPHQKRECHCGEAFYI